MPTVEQYLTSIQDALSCVEARLGRGWPGDETGLVLAELADIDERLWALCEGGDTR